MIILNRRRAAGAPRHRSQEDVGLIHDVQKVRKNKTITGREKNGYDSSRSPRPPNCHSRCFYTKGVNATFLKMLLVFRKTRVKVSLCNILYIMVMKVGSLRK